ncbi:DEAD/DEAH box helicase [Desulfuromonas acetexigens]|uniref:ATP-dependent RNA helicase DeaD n=1 Tax=Trichloromonas acetexigens TaxID=38815 RepID=A0A550JL12_9BACT|nr:DEAD/DEAH box helicase [Desulfuromonas acetexigens]TRO83885.1 DEAD/DEAH box helicase [Desulfuromonas acetexigens]
MSEEAIVSFAELALAPAVFRVIDEVGYETPSPIQAQSIPPLLEGRDLLGQAQTGTGKTAAFSLPLLSRIDPALKYPQILVLTPTRELALQVAEAMQTYARHLPDFQVLPVYGGQNMSQQLRQLHRGVQAVVGTPGRIQDHLRRGTLKLDRLLAVVVDEADEMLKMGFIEEVEQILEHAPPTRQTALFSATMPSEVLQVARRHLKNPVEIRIKNKTSTVETISQRFWQVKGLHKLDALTRILEAEDIDGMIIFVRTKIATVELAEKLEGRGFSCAPLNGDMTQAMREKTVERLKNGSLDIVVATDVAARGLDVKRISHVVNYDIPYDTEAYIHRIGRTGRAGREGKAILFVAPRERRMLNAIEQATRQPITPMTLPSRKDITDRRIGLFREMIAETMESQDLEFFEELIDNYQDEYDVGLRRIAATLAYLVQKDKPLQMEGGAEEKIEAAPEFVDRPRVREKTGDSRRYRIEVGRIHGVEPRHIVGAISNEAQLSSTHIGQIKLHDAFSLVDLPADLPKETIRLLKDVWVCGQRLQLSLDGGRPESGKEKPFKKRPGKKVEKAVRAKPIGKKPPVKRKSKGEN